MSVINPTATTPVVATVPVGTQPFGLAISPDGSTVYAANGPDTVSFIDTNTNTVTRTVTIDTQPETQWHSVAVSPDGGQIYVSDLADRTVRIVTIEIANRAPVAGTPSVGTPDRVTGVVTGSLNFTDPDGDTLTYSVPTQPARGTVTLTGSTYTFTPTQAARDAAAQTPGPDSASVTVVASDGEFSTPVTFSVPIAPPNRAPTAGTPSVGTPNPSNGVVSGALNFTDPDGDSLTYSVPTQPSSGAVTVTAGTYTYTPTQAARDAAAQTPGPDEATFTVVASDGLASTPVSVTVPISPTPPPNVAPVAGTPSVGSPDQITGAISGALNFTDPNGDALTYTVTSQPSGGIVTVQPNGTYTYTPTQAARLAAGATPGVDTNTFTVTASDGQASTPVTVNVSVSPAVISAPSSSAQTGVNPMGVAVSSTKTYVANQNSNTLTVIDRANPTATPVTINVVGAPAAIALSADGSRAYVAGNNGVSVINTTTNQVIATVTTNGGQSYGIAVFQDSNGQHRVYVTNSGNNTLRVINAATAANTAYTLGASIALNQNTPAGIAVSADGSRVYVANWNSNSVSVINTANNTLVGSPIAVGTNPFGIVVGPNGRVYVSNHNSGSVSVINTTTPTPTVSTIAVGTQPFGMAISPDRSLVYAVNGNDTVSIINTSTNTVIRTVTIDSQPETQWHSVAVSPDGRQICVSDMADRTVRILTINTDTTQA